MPRRRASVAVLVGVALAACGTAPTEERAPVAEELAALEGPVVATVDGTAITLPEVQDVVRRTGLSPRDALARLEEEIVLSRAAGTPDPVDRAEADRVARRAAVQALIIHDVEERITPDSLDAAEVAARIAHDAAMFAQPERRASVHVLCRPNRDAPEGAAAAERFCRGALEALVAAPDPQAAAEAYAATDTTGRTFTVTVESVRAARREGELAAEYAGALFELEGPGVYPEVVHTRFGFHVIVLTAIEPPWEMPPGEVERIVRRQLAAERRAEALEALATELGARVPVELDERGVDLAVRAPLEDAP